LRPGGVSLAALESVLGIRLQRAAPEVTADAPRRSPGSLDRHYAPSAPLRMVAPGDAIALATTIDALRGDGRRIGLVAYSDFDLPFRDDVVVRMMPARAEAYASALFAALHDMDDAGVKAIVVETVPTAPIWDAVRDRLRRAAALP
ncbi:MAG TPA: Sua5 family C-terminal domain-containing protein, partial [Gemmatimonadaceae bacterium]|nr:Sua5 family C-terminal domain-containing protein [Gemmatimonadaceae bacterium]